MDLTTYGLFLLTSAAVGAAPGPSTLLVLSHALGQDPRRPASLIAGAFCGNVVLVLATVLGLSAVILASQTASWRGRLRRTAAREVRAPDRE